MNLYCIRHGETEFNAAGRIQGQLDSALSPLGKRQCEAVAEELSKLTFDLIYASPLKRALDSAQTIANRLGVDIRCDHRLKEINAGIFQGHCWKEIEQVHPEAARLWRSQDPDYRIPGGESRRDVMLRAVAAFAEMRSAGLKQIVVVGHGGSLSAAFKGLLDIPAQRNPFTLQNGSISRLAWTDRDLKLLSLNETGHLHGLVRDGGDL
jgi:broad specificity phosphatase PhoE